ncbi:MAG: YheT family hydrolase [Planctomycetota bacterium]
MKAFRPLPLLRNPHLQTFLGSQASLARAPRSTRREVRLEDGDRLLLLVSTPAGYDPARDTTVVLVHGLTGSERSSYMRRVAAKLVRRGVRAVRLDLRDAGEGEGLARRPYHAGCSGDVLAVLRELRPESARLALVGYSLGGNVALKLAGELGPDGGALLDLVAAFCPAVCMHSCSERIHRRENRIYERTFVKELVAMAERRHARFPELGPLRLPARLRLREFDELYMAPTWGFRDADDYYTRASSSHVLPRIAVPTRVLIALDDPIIDPAPLAGELPACVEVARSPRGGHLGFLGRAPRHGVQYMDARLFGWLGLDA